MFLRPAGGHVDTVLVNGEIRKENGHLVGHDLAALRAKANAALDNIERAAADLHVFGPDELATFVGQAERGASVNYAMAYPEMAAPVSESTAPPAALPAG